MKPTRSQDGFLLLEVVLAVALVAIAMFAIISALGRCLAATQSVQNYTTAQNLLTNRSYIFRVERPKDYLDQEGDFEDYPGFTWSRRFEPVYIEDFQGLWKQTITVEWRERGQPASEEIVEYRYLPEKQL